MNNDALINALLRAIENKLQWGNAKDWSSYDFDKLTELIFEDTKTTISSNTLKRVWGRIKYESTPSDITLNTLAKFLGYEDFRTFTKTASAKTITRTEKTTKRPAINWPLFNSRPSIILATGAVFMLAAIIALSYNSIGTRYDSDDFYFTSRKVTKGLPNSVVFEYRASTVPESAKLEIQQSWDKNKRMTVSREDSLATSIYFDPGYFNSKLVVDGQVVKEHSFLIPSDGWKAKVESGENTLYFKDSSIAVSGKVAITNQLLANAGIDYDKVPLQTNYRYVDDFEDLRVNDLVIETEIRNTHESGLNVCRQSSITLLMEGEAIKIPLSNIGCISDLELWHLDRAISGKNNDLSGLGVDFDSSIKVRLTLKNDRLTVMLEGRKAIELPMMGRINKFHGLIYRFKGTGEISSLKVENSKKIYLQCPIDSVKFSTNTL